MILTLSLNFLAEERKMQKPAISDEQIRRVISSYPKGTNKHFAQLIQFESEPRSREASIRAKIQRLRDRGEIEMCIDYAHHELHYEYGYVSIAIRKSNRSEFVADPAPFFAAVRDTIGTLGEIIIIEDIHRVDGGGGEGHIVLFFWLKNWGRNEGPVKFSLDGIKWVEKLIWVKLGEPDRKKLPQIP